MAKTTLRQLAKQYNLDLNALINAVGAKNGSEPIDDTDPRLQAFLNIASASSDAPVYGNNDEYNAAYKNAGNSGTMIGDVAQKLTETLDGVALDMRLDAESFLERRVIHYMGISSSNLPKRSSENPFAEMVQGGYQHRPLEMWTALPPTVEQRQLAAVTNLQSNFTPPSTLPLEVPLPNSSTNETTL